MNDGLLAMNKFLLELNPDDLTPDDAAKLFRFFNATGHIAVAAMELVVPVMNQGGCRASSGSIGRGGPSRKQRRAVERQRPR